MASEINMTIRFRGKLADGLEKKAEEFGTAKSHIVRAALAQYLKIV